MNRLIKLAIRKYNHFQWLLLLISVSLVGTFFLIYILIMTL